MNNLRTRRGDKPDDYKRLGIDENVVSKWEDSQRVGGEAGYFEWWYFDAHLNDGSKLVVVFGSKPYEEASLPNLVPYIKFNLDTPDGKTFEKIFRVPEDEFSAAKDECNVKIGNSSFKGDLQNYQIHVDFEEVKASITLKNTGVSWRPKTGYRYYGDQDEYFDAWLVAVPTGEVNATISIGDNKNQYTGLGYHDHNWGNAPMAKLINHWYWGGAVIGDYRIICAHLVAEKAFGYNHFDTFYILKKGELMAGEVYNVKFTTEEKYYDEYTGKPVYNHIVYEDEGGNFRVTFDRKADIVRRRLVDSFSEPKKSMAIKAGFDGAYLRFTGNARIEHLNNDQVIEMVEGHALWELMYFGKERNE